MKPSLALLLIAASAIAADDPLPYLRNRVDEAKKAMGIVVGTIDANGQKIVGYGKFAANRPDKPDGDTVFEIGSITKVFTSLLLADMVERGEVTLDTPVPKLLPETVKVPSRNGKQITLLDLSMQVSGLPRMPSNFKPADPTNPYADYDAPKLYEFLSGYTLTRDIGEKYDYSNIGVGLLGHALARKAGMTYEALLRDRILTPLKMTSTSITLSAAQRQHLAPGHDTALTPVKNWDLDALAGAGAIRSTVNDMLKFLAANMELTDTPLKPAMRRMRAQRRPTGAPELDIMMAWHVFTRFGTEIVWHNGGTGGYRSFAGFVPEQKTGVVVLCNTSFDNDDLGRHLLEAKWPVAKYDPPKIRTEIQLDPKTLASYIGDYQLAPTFVITVTTESGHLYAQASNQPRFELFAEKDGEFFLKVVDAQITFGRDDAGKVNHLILHQNGMHQKATKK